MDEVYTDVTFGVYLGYGEIYLAKRVLVYTTRTVFFKYQTHQVSISHAAFMLWFTQYLCISHNGKIY